jgi:hypothetical protein
MCFCRLPQLLACTSKQEPGKTERSKSLSGSLPFKENQ